jgi:hypothetical protein
MLTKSDFQQAIADSINKYPAVAPLYLAGDPRIIQHLDAMATMLAMLSAQVETAMTEPFEKVRDSTVLADAAMRGIVRKGTPARVRVKVSNKSSEACALVSGRNLFDSAGHIYRLETSATVAAGAETTVEATQIKEVTVSHTVAGSEPFYSILVPQSDDGHLASISVSDAQGIYEHRERYVNTMAGDRCYHVEADHQQNVYVRFGLDGVAGVQPTNGAVINLLIGYTSGEIYPALDSPFSLQYLQTPAESYLELSMHSIVAAGKNPVSMSVLRELSRYPSVYDHNAVYLGEFDFLVRRAFPDLKFLSVWNEVKEEAARGANVDNINRLFVACLSSEGEPALIENDPNNPTGPLILDDPVLSSTQKSIKDLILSADDSYKIRFYSPVVSLIQVNIHATVAPSYRAADVRQQIIDVVLAEFGRDSAAARRGYNRPSYQRMYARLKAAVPALTAGEADVKLEIQDAPTVAKRPEVWRFVTLESLSVTVESSSMATSVWGA